MAAAAQVMVSRVSAMRSG